MPSPVWLGEDPTLDLDNIIDDFLLGESDGYFDQGPSRKRKRLTDDANGQPGSEEGSKAPRKLQKLLQKDKVARSSAAAPIVVWRTRRHSPVAYPVVDGGTGRGVAIFKDWRERSKDSPHGLVIDSKRRPGQTSFAVVVERRQPDEEDMMPPVVKSKEDQPFWRREAKPCINGQSSTASSRARDTDKRGSAPTTVLRPTLAQKGNPTVAAARKRKLSDLADEEDELQADFADFAQPKKRVLRESGQPVTTQNSAQPTTNGARGRKRKAPEPESEAPTMSAKRTASVSKVAKTSDTGKGPDAKAKSTSGTNTRKKKGI